MRIAMPIENGFVNQHFGRSKDFVVLEIGNGNIVSQKIVSAEQLQHNHEGLAGLMKQEAVNVVIVGGIGQHALKALEESGLKVVSGGQGPVEEVAAAFARGELTGRPQACCHHHGDHHHQGGHGCNH